MKTKVFIETVVDPRLKSCRELLDSIKDSEYTRNDDKFYNFKEAARLRKTTKWEAWDFMFMKHMVSTFDIIDDLKNKNQLPSPALMKDKFGDVINYLLLLEGMVCEEIFKTDLGQAKALPIEDK